MNTHPSKSVGCPVTCPFCQQGPVYITFDLDNQIIYSACQTCKTGGAEILQQFREELEEEEIAVIKYHLPPSILIQEAPNEDKA